MLTHWSVAQAGSNDEKNWRSKLSLDCSFSLPFNSDFAESFPSSRREYPGGQAGGHCFIPLYLVEGERWCKIYYYLLAKQLLQDEELAKIFWMIWQYFWTGSVAWECSGERPTNHEEHQPTNQPTNQPTIQPTNQPPNHPTNHPTNQPTMRTRTSQPESAENLVIDIAACESGVIKEHGGLGHIIWTGYLFIS